MTLGRSKKELEARLLELAAALTGYPPRALVDDDGDVQLADSPFGVWARIVTRDADGSHFIGLVTVPLLELPSRESIQELVTRTLPGPPVAWDFGSASLHVFSPYPLTLLEDPQRLRQAWNDVAALGRAIVAAVQPSVGGLTAEQQRVLAGWRGHDEGIEARLRAITAEVGGKLLRHGWDPESESRPLLVREEREDGLPTRRFVTVERDGAVRLRSAVARSLEGSSGWELTIRRLDTETAKRWAHRLGVEASSATLGAADLALLGDRTWKDLTAALGDLPHESGDAWQATGPE